MKILSSVFHANSYITLGLPVTKLGGKTTNPPICNHGEEFACCFVVPEVLFSTFSRNKRHGNANVFKKAKSVKEAVSGTWLVCPGQKERKEQPRTQGPLSSSLEKVPWFRLVTWHRKSGC